MTFIHSSQRSGFLGKGLFFLLATFFLGEAVWLVVIYNGTVNTNALVVEASQKLQKVETENAELKTKLFNMTNPENLRGLVSERGLVQERAPEYVRLQESWDAFASQ